VVTSLIELDDYCSLAEHFLIFLNIPVLRVVFMPPPSISCGAGRSFGAPTELPLLLLSLLFVLQGARMQNAHVCWPG